MNQDFIYLDNNATRPLDPRVLEAMMPYLTNLYGNASSSHRLGKQIKSAVDRARGQMGDLINANPEDVIYTAGSTEAINIALRGLHHVRPGRNHHIITVTTEHPAVLDTCLPWSLHKYGAKKEANFPIWFSLGRFRYKEEIEQQLMR